MTADDQRSSRRNQILMLAQLRLDGVSEPLTIRVRDLSAGGLRAHYAGPRLSRVRLAVEIRNLGWIPGSVAWQDGAHIGIRFDNPIDPEATRIAVTGNLAAPVPSPAVNQRRV